jgi:branched-chain amino acid transport system ATP-binding protein
MLEVSGLTVRYGAVVALHGVSMEVQEGRVTTVLGANGAGKTTLLRAISGLVPASAGSVALDGGSLRGRAVEAITRLGVIHVPEGGGVIREMTVMENLRLGGLWRRQPADSARVACEVFDLFPALRSLRSTHAVSLSGGERQMLAIGRALMARPRWLLLDEPSLGLAPGLVTEIMRLIRRLSRERGLSVLLVEQNAGIALSIADDAVVLSQGRVVAAGTAAEITHEADLWHAYLGY